MKKETKDKMIGLLMLLSVMVMFVFVLLAITSNMRNELLNTNDAWIYNLIGWFLVPCFAIVGAILLRKARKNPDVIV